MGSSSLVVSSFLVASVVFIFPTRGRAGGPRANIAERSLGCLRRRWRPWGDRPARKRGVNGEAGTGVEGSLLRREDMSDICLVLIRARRGRGVESSFLSLVSRFASASEFFLAPSESERSSKEREAESCRLSDSVLSGILAIVREYY